MRAIDADVFEVVAWTGIPEGYNDTFGDGVDWILEKIDRQPTIIPERKTGKWIKMSDADGSFTACSECGEWWFNCETNYCPTCGVRMKKDGTTEVNVVRTWMRKETK